MTLTVGVCPDGEPEGAADELPAAESVLSAEACTLADVPDEPADTPACTAGVEACATADDELPCPESPDGADSLTGAADVTVELTVLVTALAVPVTAPPAALVTACAVPVTAPTVPVTALAVPATAPPAVLVTALAVSVTPPTVLLTAPTVPATAPPTVPVTALAVSVIGRTVFVTAPTLPVTALVTAPTVFVTAPTLPVTALVTAPTVPVTAPPMVPVTAPAVPVTAPPTVPVTAPTVPVTSCTAWPTVVTVVATAPVAVWVTWVTGPLVPTVTGTTVVVLDDPGGGFCPVTGAGPGPTGGAGGVGSVVGGEPCPVPAPEHCPLPPAEPCLMLTARRGRIGGPARTGRACALCRGWLVLGWMMGGPPEPNRFGGITRTTTAITNVMRATATAMTALGTANPAGCSRAAATTDLYVFVAWPDANRIGAVILCMLELEHCADMLMKLSFY